MGVCVRKGIADNIIRGRKFIRGAVAFMMKNDEKIVRRQLPFDLASFRCMGKRL